jgi:hypothetical protein
MKIYKYRTHDLDEGIQVGWPVYLHPGKAWQPVQISLGQVLFFRPERLDLDKPDVDAPADLHDDVL